MADEKTAEARQRLKKAADSDEELEEQQAGAEGGKKKKKKRREGGEGSVSDLSELDLSEGEDGLMSGDEDIVGREAAKALKKEEKRRRREEEKRKEAEEAEAKAREAVKAEELEVGTHPGHHAIHAGSKQQGTQCLAAAARARGGAAAA